MSSLTPSNGQLFTLPYTQPLSVDGKPMPLCYRVFYETNSTNPLNVYSDAALQTSLGNVVTANAYGQFQPIFLLPGYQYRCQLFNAANQLLEDADPVNQNASGTPFMAGVVRSAVKNSSTSRTSTTLLADPDLQIFVPGAGTYKIDLDLVFTASASGATPGVQMYLGAFATVVNALGGLPVAGTVNSTVAQSPLTFNAQILTLSLGTTSLSNTMRYSGTVQLLGNNSGNANGTTNVLFEWATANAGGTTTLVAGSSMTITQVA